MSLPCLALLFHALSYLILFEPLIIFHDYFDQVSRNLYSQFTCGKTEDAGSATEDEGSATALQSQDLDVNEVIGEIMGRNEAIRAKDWDDRDLDLTAEEWEQWGEDDLNSPSEDSKESNEERISESHSKWILAAEGKGSPGPLLLYP